MPGPKHLLKAAIDPLAKIPEDVSNAFSEVMERKQRERDTAVKAEILADPQKYRERILSQSVRMTSRIAELEIQRVQEKRDQVWFAMGFEEPPPRATTQMPTVDGNLADLSTLMAKVDRVCEFVQQDMQSRQSLTGTLAAPDPQAVQTKKPAAPIKSGVVQGHGEETKATPQKRSREGWSSRPFTLKQIAAIVGGKANAKAVTIKVGRDNIEKEDPNQKRCKRWYVNIEGVNPAWADRLHTLEAEIEKSGKGQVVAKPS